MLSSEDLHIKTLLHETLWIWICFDRWSCTIVAVIKMQIWHRVGWVDVQMRTCLRLHNEKIWMWRNVQKGQWAIWAEAVSGHLTSSSDVFYLSFSLSIQTCMSFVWIRFSSWCVKFLTTYNETSIFVMIVNEFPRLPKNVHIVREYLSKIASCYLRSPNASSETSITPLRSLQLLAM